MGLWRPSLNVDWSYRRLVQAFHEQNRESILRAASDLGHYGDAHVSLHTTLNYNGQLTGQKGIHALWETRARAVWAEYFLAVPEPIWIPNVSAWTGRIQESHAAVDSVLRLEREAVAAGLATRCPGATWTGGPAAAGRAVVQGVPRPVGRHGGAAVAGVHSRGGFVLVECLGGGGSAQLGRRPWGEPSLFGLAPVAQEVSPVGGQPIT